MKRRDFLRSAVTAGVVTWMAPPTLWSQSEIAPAGLSREEIEEFLKSAKVMLVKESSQGITRPKRATLSDGHLTHDAQIQSIDESRSEFEGANGAKELNFRDTYKFNIAAYRLDKIMGLNMIPPSVSRSYVGKTSAFTWWVDDVLMTEGDRIKQKLTPPNQEVWNRQLYIVRVFDQLIHNTDRNLGNLLITKDWSVWMIDHTRAFRLMKTLRNPGNLAKCDRKMLETLRSLNREKLNQPLRDYLRSNELDALLVRRDLIVQFFDQEVRAKGEQEVLFDYIPRV